MDGPLIVVRAPGQELPRLPAGVLLAEDSRAGGGPLAGILAGLDGGRGRPMRPTCRPSTCPACDRRSFAACWPGSTPRPTSCCRRRTASGIRWRRPTGRRSRTRWPRSWSTGGPQPAELYAAVRTRVVGPDWLLADPLLAAADPDLASLLNVNDPDAYAPAHSVAFPP